MLTPNFIVGPPSRIPALARADHIWLPSCSTRVHGDLEGAEFVLTRLPADRTVRPEEVDARPLDQPVSFDLAVEVVVDAEESQRMPPRSPLP